MGGGIERHCEQLYPMMARLGYDITVLSRRPYIPPKDRGKEWHGVKFISVPCPRKKSAETFLHTLLGVFVAWARGGAVLHLHGIGPSFFSPLARILGMKVIVTHHGPDYERAKWGRLARAFLRLAEVSGLRFSNREICVAGYLAANINKKTLGRYAEKLSVIPNGVPKPEIIPPGQTLQRLQLQPRSYIFAVGRFVPEKALHHLVEAYSRLQLRSVKLVIAGGADHETAYSRSLRELALAKDANLVGFVYGKELAELYSSAGLFVLPSLFEGLPIALLEALSFRIPVLASSIPANHEIELDKESYFEAGNIEELASKIEELWPIRNLVSAENRFDNVLSDRYSWENIVQKTATIYQEVIARNLSKRKSPAVMNQ